MVIPALELEIAEKTCENTLNVRGAINQFRYVFDFLITIFKIVTEKKVSLKISCIMNLK